MERPSVFLLLLSLLCVWARGEAFALAPIELAPIPCNDKAVEKLSRLAITYLNEDRGEGYKFALNRIANVFLHAQGPAGNVYYLDLDVLETKCHVGSPKPWKRCDVRPFMETQISGNCNTTLLHTPEGYTYLYSYDCFLVPDPPEKLQQTCPTCPLMVPVDSPQAEDAAALTLAHFKRQSTLAARLGLKKITRAATQTRPVKARFVEYTVQECPEGLTDRGTCQRLTVDSDTQTAGFCAGSVHGEMNEHPEVQVSCEMFKTQNVDVLRPLEPQVHDIPAPPAPPTFPPIFAPLPDPTLPPPAVEPAPLEPTPPPPPPFDPPVAPPPAPVGPPAVLPGPFASSSSESEECFRSRQAPPASPAALDSSSEEVLGLVALRPPLNFRYQRRDRRRRQALMETTASHNPIFLTNFPSGPSPFRSCPGPSRYTTV